MLTLRTRNNINPFAQPTKTKPVRHQMFLPKDYTSPKSSANFMKLQDGENKIRILSAPIIGWEDWVDSKPIRYRMDDKPQRSHDPKRPVRHFWAMIVWNYAADAIQVLHLTQASVRTALETLCHDADWGAPYSYDVKIVKSGQKMDTEYVVNPLPHKPVSKEIVAAFKAKRCNLEAIFDNADPFDSNHVEWTPGQFEGGEDTGATTSVTPQQVKELQSILDQCPSAYQNKVKMFLAKNHDITSLDELTPDIYETCYASALKNIETASNPFEV